MADRHARDIAQAEQSLRAGQVQAAESRLLRVLKAYPRHARASELLGYITGNRGELDRSFELLKIAASAPETSGEAHYYLGKHYLDRGLFAEAQRAFETALKRVGDFFEGLHDWGVALSGGGQMEAALVAYDRAQRINANSAQLHYNRGVALDALKRFDEALSAYDQAIHLDSQFAVAWENRGATLNDMHNYAEAMASHERTIALMPGSAQAWSNRGVTLGLLRQYKEALESHQKALSLNPDLAEAWGRSGDIFWELKQHAQAVACFDKALALRPDLPYVRGDALHLRMMLCEWHNADEFNRILQGIDADGSMTSPFAALAMPTTRAQQMRCGGHYAKDRYPAPSGPWARIAQGGEGKICLGYFSPDFRSHAVSFLTAGLLEQHDRRRFEVHAFALGSEASDPMTQRIKSAVDAFHDVSGLPDQDIVERARACGIDIAIDLAGHTQGARTGIFARRVAPLQVNYLGYPGTMGAPFMDYIIADRIVAPESHAPDYAEKIVLMPDSFQVNDDERPLGNALTRSQYGLDEDAFVFCCFNASYKITPNLFSIWLNLLRQTERSVLWLVAHSDAQADNLRRYACERQISGNRLIFAQHVPYRDHLARYQLADLALDTLPFNGGTTTSDALWGGAPVLTCMGETFAGRMAASLLTAVGLRELITTTAQEYEEKALHLTRHPQHIARLKQQLTNVRGQCPLFDTRLFARNLESAYHMMWQRHQAGLPADHLSVSSSSP